MENKKHTILVVDDDANVVEILRLNLTEAGYNVVTALNGRDGLKMFSENKPELIIVDLIMPGMDGYRFIWEIFFEDGLYGGLAPKVVILTGRDEKLDKGVSEKIGVAAYITKPFKIEYIIDKINKLLGVETDTGGKKNP